MRRLRYRRRVAADAGLARDLAGSCHQLYGRRVSRPTVRAACAVIAAAVITLAGCGDDPERPERDRSLGEVRAQAVEPGPVVDVGPDLGRVAHDAERAVRSYYRALDDLEFDAAWARLAPSLQTEFGGFAEWQRGYEYTLSTTPIAVSATASDARHATVDISVRAIDLDACVQRVRQRFEGSWTVARRGGRWIATDIDMEKTRGAEPVRVEAECPQSDADGPPSLTVDEEICFDDYVLPAVDVGDYHIPAQTIEGGCYDASDDFLPDNTTYLADEDYADIDRSYSAGLTRRYWSSDPSTAYPDYSAPGFGEHNAAGYPRNQYVRAYVRRDGTYVSGYWRNSPADGLPTCRIVNC